MICLPIPPSVNELYRKAAFKGGKGRTVTPKYAAWREEAGLRLNLAAWDTPAPPYGIKIRMNINHNSDIDNRIKPLLDLLVKHGVLTGDQWVNALHVYRDRTIDGCIVEFFDTDCITIGEAANRVLAGLVVE